MLDFSITRHSYLQTSKFFSKGVMAKFTLFSSMLAMSFLQSRKAKFSRYWISRAVMSSVHLGLRGIFKSLYYGFLMLDSVRKLLSNSFCAVADSTEPYNTSFLLMMVISFSAVNCLLESWASCTNSSREF